MTDGPVEHDLELTVSALKDGVLDLGISGGLVEIGAGLAELRGELESDAPDTATVAGLLRDLGRRTLTVGETLDEGDTRRAVVELGNLLVREAETLPKE